MTLRNKFFLVLFAIFMSSSAYAKAILDIAPSSTVKRAVTLTANGSTTITYSVVNNTNKRTINTLTIDPYYNIPGNPLTLTVQNNQCTVALPPGASCSFGLLVKANGSATNTVLEPRVCDYDSGTCSVPILSNRISVSAGGVASSIAYILNAAANTVSICPVNLDTGALATCAVSTASGTLTYPLGVVVNPQNSALFIANNGVNTVAICPIVQNGSGALGTCTTTDGNGTFANPDSVALNSTGTMLYVTNFPFGTPTVSICPVINNGSSVSLGTCTVSLGNGTFDQLQAVILNPDNTFAYILNASNTVSICPLNADGSFGTCTLTNGNGTFNFPQGISFSADNTFAYIANFGNGTQPQSTVSVCPLLQDGSGGFGTCFISTGNAFNFTSNAEAGLYMISPSFFGYVPNNGMTGTNASSISICPINTTTHNLGTCSVFTDPSFSQPTAVSLSYTITGIRYQDKM